MNRCEAPFPVLANVDWQPVAVAPAIDSQHDPSIPVATHAGVWLEPLFGLRLRCFRLSNGQAVIHEEDFHRFMDHLANSKSEVARS